jgi:hypothetical protein
MLFGSVVNQNVQASKRLHDLLYCVDAKIFISHIARDKVHFAPCAFQVNDS